MEMEVAGIVESISRPLAIRQVLQENGINILRKANLHRNRPHGPGEWLLRGAMDKTPLFEGKMEPKSGDYGSSGVFFADDPDKVLTHDEGMIVVMRSDIQGGDWILSPSLKFDQIAEQAAQRYGYDRTTVVGGLHAEEEVYKNYPVYQWIRNCATFPGEVSLGDVAHILVTPNFLNSADLERIPKEIKEKIVKLDYNVA